MKIFRGVVPKAQRVVIYGPEGIGKTTFASQFPEPLFIDAEDGSKHMDVARVSETPPSSWQMLTNYVDEVIQDKPCKTLVLDTIDKAESLCKEHLCAQNGWKAIDASGYGQRFVALNEEIGRLLNKFNEVIEAGINVVIISHSNQRKVEDPGEMGSYDHWELNLEKKNSPMVKQWADAVFFVTYKVTIITDDGNHKKATGGTRVMYTTHHPAYDAKNRWGLPDELPLDYSQIAPALARVTTSQVDTARERAGKWFPQDEAQTPPPADKDEPPVKKTQPEPPEAAAAPPYDEQIPDCVPQKVADLMRLNHVTIKEFQEILFKGHFMPADTPLENVPADLYDHIAAKWNDALNLLNTEIRK